MTPQTELDHILNCKGGKDQEVPQRCFAAINVTKIHADTELTLQYLKIYTNLLLNISKFYGKKNRYSNKE